MDSQTSPTMTAASSHRRYAQHGVNYYYARHYDYWWPYPPAGATTTSTTTFPQWTPTDDTLLASPTDTSTPALSVSIDSESAVSSSSAVSSASDGLNVTSMVSSTASSSFASESVVSISALPPSNTTVAANSFHKISMLPTSNLIYIVPICGVIGLLIGGITTWCVYGCLTRNGHGRRRGRKSYGTLEVGPEYTPPSPLRGEKQELAHEEDEWVGDEKHVEESDEDDDADEERGTETEGFLHPGSAQTRPTRSTIRTKSAESATTVSTAARAKSTRSSRGPSPTPSGRTSLFFDRPDSTDALPWESLRHKSIKRGILERLRYDEPQDSKDRIARRPWQAHGRHDSDLLVTDAQADLSRASSSVTSAALSRASSSVTASTRPGFRILTESPAGTPQRERGAEVFRWPSVVEDRYTRVPERVARSRSRSPEKASRASSPEKFERGRSPDKLVRAASPPVRRGGRGRPSEGDKFNARPRGRTDDTDDAPADFRNVLPQSPPRISSPVLDGALPSETTPEMTSFASFGAPAAEDTEWMKRGAGERTFRRGRE
ncbi:hypothetical protein B0H19DRAFT_1102242 [Mycena capillaripes]|nr:hypothetical protein B0H19DRAFT_1102242 [Mycena capillaripes]